MDALNAPARGSGFRLWRGATAVGRETHAPARAARARRDTLPVRALLLDMVAFMFAISMCRQLPQAGQKDWSQLGLPASHQAGLTGSETTNTGQTREKARALYPDIACQLQTRWVPAASPIYLITTWPSRPSASVLWRPRSRRSGPAQPTWCSSLTGGQRLLAAPPVSCSAERGAEAGASLPRRCPDCVQSKEGVRRAAASRAVPLLEVDVGDRGAWRAPAHPLRTDPRFGLSGIPTLFYWADGKPQAKLGEEGWGRASPRSCLWLVGSSSSSSLVFLEAQPASRPALQGRSWSLRPARLQRRLWRSSL